MANVVTHPHLQVGFHRGPVHHSPSPLGFGFGLSSAPAMAGWPTPSHIAQPSWNTPANLASSSGRASKRRHETDEEPENKHARDDDMDRSPTPERPKRTAPKRARTTPALTTSTKDGRTSKENKPPVGDDESDVDVGVLLASLPPQSLLPLLSALLTSQPSLKANVLSLIPRPTLETALHALANAASKLRDAYPYSNSPFSHTGASTSFGFGGTGFGSNRSNAPTASGFGSARSLFGSSHQMSAPSTGGMRDEYIISRLRPHITEFVSACFSYLPYFSYVATTAAELNTSPSLKSQTRPHAAALQSQHRDRSHPTETFVFLSALTSHILSQPPLTQSSLVPQLLPRLTEEWKAWVDRVDQVVNREGGMFGSETVRSWERELDEYAQEKDHGLDVLRQIRDHWVTKVGWLVGRQQPMES